MGDTQTISNTRIPAGSHTFNFTNTTQVWSEANVTIDRTINGGLNSLTTADTLSLEVDCSLDGGTTWRNCGAATYEGGVLTTKGVTQTTEYLGVSLGEPFQIGTPFRVVTVASTAVRIAGTIDFS